MAQLIRIKVQSITPPPHLTIAYTKPYTSFNTVVSISPTSDSAYSAQTSALPEVSYGGLTPPSRPLGITFHRLPAHTARAGDAPSSSLSSCHRFLSPSDQFASSQALSDSLVTPCVTFEDDALDHEMQVLYHVVNQGTPPPPSLSVRKD